MKLTLFASLYVKIRKDFRVVYTEEKKKGQHKDETGSFSASCYIVSPKFSCCFFPISLLAVKTAAVIVHNLTCLVSFPC